MRRVVFEDILVRLGVPRPPVDVFATESNHLCSVWWGPGGEHEDAFTQRLKGQFFLDKPPIPCWMKWCTNSPRMGRVQFWFCQIVHGACGGDVYNVW